MTVRRVLLALIATAFAVPAPTHAVPTAPEDPVVAAATGWAVVSGGGDHTCGIRTDGSLWCWGSNVFGMLGVGDGSNEHAYRTRVGTATDWVPVTTRGFHACGIRAGGTLWCWGRNDQGQLGVGDHADRHSPVQVGAVAWALVAAGNDHTCGVRFSQMLCWGDNAYGQLGLGDTTDRLSPQQVGTTIDWRTVQVGGYHVCGLGLDDRLWCWGYNVDGELGLGDTTNRKSPVQVPAP